MEAVFSQKLRSTSKEYENSFFKIVVNINVRVSKNGCNLKDIWNESTGKFVVEFRRGKAKLKIDSVREDLSRSSAGPQLSDLIFGKLTDQNSNNMEAHVENSDPSTGIPLNIPETLVSASLQQNKHDVPKITSACLEETQTPAEPGMSLETNRNSSQGMVENYRRFSQSGDNIHVTQSRSIFSHEDKFVYGNPKEDIKNLESQATKEYPEVNASLFERNAPNALDLSCKAVKPDDKPFKDGNTYQNYQKDVLGNETFPRSITDGKSSKKPSLPEQLHIAKMQQQQRRSMHHQQKFLQQVRRDLDAKYSNRQENTPNNQKTIKYHSNIPTNHEHNESDNHSRPKEEYQTPTSGPHNFTQPPRSFFDTGRSKELPDNHPILPLLDPVYFSALYNAHGFLPPSSPTIAAAFIGTLQDTLPKFPNLFPSTSSNSSPLYVQKTNQNQN